MINPSPHMKKALKLAIDGSEKNEIPVGVVIVDTTTNQVIVSSHNRVEECGDPTAHAEILAIKDAAKKMGSKWLNSCSLYVTLEPCPMCAQAISLARIKSLYYGAEDLKSGGVDHGPRVLHKKTAHHKPEIYGGIMESECSRILKEFFAKKRF